MDTFLEYKKDLCDRKVGKNATLVIGYGGKRRGITGRFMGKKTWVNLGTQDEPQWTVRANPDSIISKLGLPEDKHWHASFALSGDYEESVYAVAPSALEVTKFLRTCVKVSNDENQPMRWLSASGVLVENHPNSKIEFNLTASSQFDDQSCTQLKYTIFDNELNKRKAVTSAPPQFIHSLDASHLHISVNAMCIQGVTALSCVHDCYGTHANDVSMMFGVVVNVFVEILETDPLGVLAEAYDVECPEYGELNLTEVREANYFLT